MRAAAPSGCGGNDTIRGSLGEGSDWVFGAAADVIGHDGDTSTMVLFGDGGNDVPVGAAGADRFVIGAGEGRDLIRDFSYAQGDRIVLNGQAYTWSASSAGSVLIDLGGGSTIELQGIAAGQGKDSFIV